VELTSAQRDFIAVSAGAAMTTLRRDGTPHTVRVGAVVVDGRLWSSATRRRARTRHLRRDPRSTLVFLEAGHGYLTLECVVTILDGPEVPEQSLRLLRAMQGIEDPEAPIGWFGGRLPPDEVRRRLIEEGRIIFEFDVQRAYGTV
jgi:hypothetical protein